MDSAFQIQIAVIVFILFLCILCFFAVMIILRDIVIENSKNRKELNELKELQLQKQEEKEEVVEEESTLTDETTNNEPTETKTDDNAVVFSSYVLTMPERYATLSNEYKRYFDDIVRYVLSKDNVKELKNNTAYVYKDASYRVLRLMIKRGEIVCELNFIDRDIKDYVDGSTVSIKQSATTIKVTEPAAVGVVKDGIDLVCSQIAEDREYKKQLAREKRKQKKAKNKQGAADEKISV